MAKDTPKTPEIKTVKTEEAMKKKWMIATIIIIAFAILAIGVAGNLLSSDQAKNEISVSGQSIVPTHEQNQQKATAEKKEGSKNNILLFSLIGAFLLAIAMIPKLPAKGLIGGAGAILLLFGIIMWASSTVWPSYLTEKNKATTENKAPGVEIKNAVAIYEEEKAALDENGQPIVLNAGDRLVVTKSENEPAAKLLFVSNDSRRFLPTDRWSATGTSYRHAGMFTKEPVKIYYIGSGNYQFRKVGGEQAQCLLDKKFTE